MRITRIILILVFLAVAAVSAVQDAAGRLSTADVPPVLTCESETLDVSVKDPKSVLLAGITATDAQDGDISHRVLVTGVSRLFGDNTARVSYAVFDSDHNMATLTRNIHYTDYQLPRFSLEEPLIYREDEDITLLDRLHARDVIDGDITGSIRVSPANRSSYSQDLFITTVQVTNSMGDTAWQTLPVIQCNDPENAVQVKLDTYLIYLKQGADFQARRYLDGASFGGDPVSLDNVTITGEVDTATPGTYMVVYDCVYGSHSGKSVLTVVIE